MITLGGDAELELVDSLDPFSEGVVFSVRPPKKSWKNIANLSGGEKVVINTFDSTFLLNLACSTNVKNPCLRMGRHFLFTGITYGLIIFSDS